MIRGTSELGYQLLRSGETETARGLFERVLDRNPNFADAHLGLVLYRGGRTREGRAHLEQAVALNPKFVRALEALARVELENGEATESESTLRRALALTPDYPTSTNSSAAASSTKAVKKKPPPASNKPCV